MKNIKRLGAVALVTAMMASPALAQQAPSFENSAIISIINGVATTIVAIGGAAFSIYGLIFAYKTIKAMVRGG